MILRKFIKYNIIDFSEFYRKIKILKNFLSKKIMFKLNDFQF